MSIVFAIQIISQVFASTVLYYTIKESLWLVYSDEIHMKI